MFAAVFVCIGIAGYFVVGGGCRSNPKEAAIELKNLTGLVESYRLDPSNDRLPESLEDLTRGEAPLTKKIPRDPWGNDYVYERVGVGYRIVSVGPDGVLDTEDDVTKAWEPKVR